MKQLVIFIVVANLYGCAAPYIAPTPSEPQASVTVRNPSPQYSVYLMAHKEPATCGGLANLRTGHGRTINKNEVQENSEFTFQVKAAQLFGLYAGSTRPDPSNANRKFDCDRVATFTPHQGARYLVEFSYEPPMCRMRVREMQTDGKLMAVPVRYRKQMPTSLSQPNPHCSDILGEER